MACILSSLACSHECCQKCAAAAMPGLTSLIQGVGSPANSNAATHDDLVGALTSRPGPGALSGLVSLLEVQQRKSAQQARLSVYSAYSSEGEPRTGCCLHVL